MFFNQNLNKIDADFHRKLTDFVEKNLPRKIQKARSRIYQKLILKSIAFPYLWYKDHSESESSAVYKEHSHEYEPESRLLVSKHVRHRDSHPTNYYNIVHTKPYKLGIV